MRLARRTIEARKEPRIRKATYEKDDFGFGGIGNGGVGRFDGACGCSVFHWHPGAGDCGSRAGLLRAAAGGLCAARAGARGSAGLCGADRGGDSGGGRAARGLRACSGVAVRFGSSFASPLSPWMLVRWGGTGVSHPLVQAGGFFVLESARLREDTLECPRASNQERSSIDLVLVIRFSR